MLEVKGEFESEYRSQAAILGEEGLDRILEAGREWDISEEIRKGGSAIFPHTYLDQCGDQIAAVVHGLLDSGADQVLVLGVVHSRDHKNLREVRLQELRGEKITDLSHWGVFQDYPGEYSLMHFHALWNAEVKRRGIRPPKLIMRYPCLVQGAPEKLLGIEELERIAKDAAVVVTADLVHHGVAYTTERKMDIGPHSEIYTRDAIHEMLDLLNKKKYPEFIQTSVHHRSDAKDVLSVLRYLKGPLSPEILSMRLIDTSKLFVNDPTPSWVAASLITLT